MLFRKRTDEFKPSNEPCGDDCFLLLEKVQKKNQTEKDLSKKEPSLAQKGNYNSPAMANRRKSRKPLNSTLYSTEVPKIDASLAKSLNPFKDGENMGKYSS